MMVNREAIAGIVVVSGLIVAILALTSYGIWDVVRQLRGENISITASSWLLRFFVRHPIAGFCAGLIVGILAGHLMWPQSLHL